MCVCVFYFLYVCVFSLIVPGWKSWKGG